MFRFLFRLVVLAVVVAAVGVFLLGWWPGGGWLQDSVLARRQTAERPIPADEVKEATAKAGEKAADLAAQAQAAISDGSVTAKIKAKMALDETVKANDIHVSFEKGVVTLTGLVASQAERTRAVALARETAGVTSVVDRLTMGQR